MLLLLLAVVIIWALLSYLLLIHEYGHLIAMQKRGLCIEKIVIGSARVLSIQLNNIRHDFGLFPIYGAVISHAYERASLRDRAIVAVCGPLASLIFGAILFVIYKASSFWLFKVAAEGSLVFFLSNLLPFPPLDGWPVTEYVFSKFGVVFSKNHQRYLLALGIVLSVVFAYFV